MRHDILPDAAFRFRSQLLAAFDRLAPSRFEYVTADRCAAGCPICHAWVTITFAGIAPRAELSCLGGCSEQNIVAALRGAA